MLPNELWNLIIYNLRFELFLYKNCILINKQLSKLVKQLYNKIPNQIYLASSVKSDYSDSKEYTLTKIDYKSLTSPNYSGVVATYSIKLEKKQLLANKQIKLFNYGCDHSICFDMNKLFDIYLKQKCYDVIINIDSFSNFRGPHKIFY